MIAKFQVYADLGVHEINLNMCLGATHEDLMGSIERLAREVMPHFSEAVAIERLMQAGGHPSIR